MTKIFYAKEKSAANVLSHYAAQHLKSDEIKAYQEKWDYIMISYHTSHLAIHSSIHIEKLPEFQEWLPELKANKPKFMPLIISAMLKGDIFMMSVYESLTDHVIGYDELSIDEKLDREFDQYGGAEDGRAMMNAKYWLVTEEAANIFREHEYGQDILCQVIELLGMNSEFVDCS